MRCDEIESKITASKVLDASNKEQFKLQLKDLLQDTKAPEGIVYVWRAELSIPRLKGSSPVIYIGKAEGSLYDRYVSYVGVEANEYWDRYDHIIKNYGSISIDIYKTNNPKITENNFIYQYHQEFMELPPINLKSYSKDLLNNDV